MEQLEQKLKELLDEADDKAIIAFVKKTVLESYRNGQKASTGNSAKEKAAPRPRRRKK